MSRQHHYLKCETEYYQAVERGEKTFELRKNDRDYKVYDIILFERSCKWNRDWKNFTIRRGD